MSLLKKVLTRKWKKYIFNDIRKIGFEKKEFFSQKKKGFENQKSCKYMKYMRKNDRLAFVKIKTVRC